MNRRSFFGTLAGAIVAAPVVPALAETMPITLGEPFGASWLVPECLEPAGWVTIDGEYLMHTVRVGDVVGIEGHRELNVTDVTLSTIAVDHQ